MPVAINVPKQLFFSSSGMQSGTRQLIADTAPLPEKAGDFCLFRL